MPSLKAYPARLQNQWPAAEQSFNSCLINVKILQKNRLHKYIITYFIAEDLIQWPTSLDQAVHSSQPEAQKAVVDALHQHNLAHNKDRVPYVATEVTGHAGLMLHIQAQRMLTTGPSSVSYMWF